MKIFKRGNTYSLPVHIKRDGEEIDISEISKAVFKFNDIEKDYPSQDVTFDGETFCFIVSLTQEETLQFVDKEVKWEAALKYNNGERKGTDVNKIPTKTTIIEEVI